MEFQVKKKGKTNKKGSNRRNCWISMIHNMMGRWTR